MSKKCKLVIGKLNLHRLRNLINLCSTPVSSILSLFNFKIFFQNIMKYFTKN